MNTKLYDPIPLDDGDALAKRAHGFAVGDRVRDRNGHVGKVTRILSGTVSVAFDGGIETTLAASYVGQFLEAA